MKRFELAGASKVPAKDFRLSIPGDLWEKVESMTVETGADPAEVIRQAIAYALDTRKPKRTRKPKTESKKG